MAPFGRAYLGHAPIIDTPDGIQDAPVTGVFFIHDPERTAARRTSALV